MSAHSGDAVRVALASSDSLEALPGTVVTAAFVISNTSDKHRTVVSTTELPPSWRLISSRAGENAIGPGESKTILVSIMVDQNASVKDYTVKFSVTDTDNPDENDSSDLVVAVQRRDNLSLTLFNSPAFAVAGDEYAVEVLIVNRGNAPVKLISTATAVPHSKITIDPSSITLAPNSEVFATINMKAPSDLYDQTRQLLQFTATPEASTESETLSIWTEVIPKGRRPDQKATIPAYVKATGLYNETGQGGQLEIGARGIIVEGSDQIVDLLIRTPDLASNYLYGRRDEYRLTYSTTNFYVRLGDHPFALSPLTEYGRLGRGIGIGLGSGKVWTELFASKNRVIFPRENQIGGSVTFELNKYADFSANYLNKDGDVNGQSISVRTRIYPLENTQLDLEVGDGARANVRSSGYALSIKSSSKWFSYNGRFIHTGPQFPGNYSNYENLASSVILKASKSLRLRGFVQMQTRSFDSGLSGSVSSSNDYFEVGPAFETDALGVPLQFAANYQVRSNTSSGTVTTIDQKETLFKVNAGVNLWKFTVGANVETGNVSSLSLGQKINARRYEISTGASMGRFNYIIGVEQQNGASLYRLQDHNVTVLRFGGDARINRQTKVNIDAFSIHDPGYHFGQYSFVQAGIEHQFSFGHIATLQASSSALDSWLRQSQPDVSFSYQVPLGLPRIGSKKLRITGKVVDAETGEGIKRVRVNLDSQVAVTNADGEFTFDRPNNGKRYLMVDQTSIGIDRTTLVANPIPITIRKETEGLPTIYVSRSGGIAGEVMYADASSVEESIIGGAVVEISDSVGKYRVITDETGSFTFNKLRPGEWRVQVVYARVKSGYESTSDVYVINVEPGTIAPVTIGFAQKSKRIKFVASGVAGKVVADSIASEPAIVSEVDDVEESCTAYVGPAPLLHSLDEGATLGSIVERYYCNPVYWPRIWLSNRAALTTARITRANTEIIIPGLGVNPTDAQPSHDSDTSLAYVVQTGETLSIMAGSFYGDVQQWPRIWLVNRRNIADPDLIYPGMVVQVPPAGTLSGIEIKFLETSLPLSND